MVIVKTSPNEEDTAKFAKEVCGDNNPIHQIVEGKIQIVPGDWLVATHLINTENIFNLGNEVIFDFKNVVFPNSNLNFYYDRIEFEKEKVVEISRGGKYLKVGSFDNLSSMNFKGKINKFEEFYPNIDFKKINNLIVLNYCFSSGELAGENGLFLKTLKENKLGLKYRNEVLKSRIIYTQSEVKLLETCPHSISREKLINISKIETKLGIPKITEIKKGRYEMNFPFYIFFNKEPIVRFSKTAICSGLESLID